MNDFENMEVVMRILITAVFVAIGVVLALGTIHGARLSQVSPHDYAQNERKHKRAMRWALWLTFAGVVLIEVGLVQIFGRHAAASVVRGHLVFAVPFLLSLIALNTVWTGHKHPVIHGWLSLATVFVLFPFTFFTGIRLLW